MMTPGPGTRVYDYRKWDSCPYKYWALVLFVPCGQLTFFVGESQKYIHHLRRSDGRNGRANTQVGGNWFNVLVPEPSPARQRLQLPSGGVLCELQTATNWTLISLRIPWNFSVMLYINICKHHSGNRISGLATQQCVFSGIQLWVISAI